MVSCINLRDTDKTVSYAGDYEQYDYEELAEEEFPRVDY